MRVLRGLTSHMLDCGCLVGVYETYGAEVVALVDVRGERCTNEWHRSGLPVAVRDGEPDEEPVTGTARPDAEFLVPGDDL